LLKEGDELPSIRTLAAKLGVNPMTISKSYAFLEQEGLVQRRPGRPLVVKAVSEARQQETKRERLREALKQPATMVRQLGIEQEEALQVFKRLLDEG
jgi:GntR family transcriptional regulator